MRIAWVLGIWFFVAQAAPVHAEKRVAQKKKEPESENDRLAREHYERGITHYNLGEFDKAIEEFKKAYELNKASSLLYNIAQAHRLQKEYAKARHFYMMYLDQKPNAKNREDVELRIQEMEDLIREAEGAKTDRPPSGTDPTKTATTTTSDPTKTTTTTTTGDPTKTTTTVPDPTRTTADPTKTTKTDPTGTTVTIDEKPAAHDVKLGPDPIEAPQRPGRTKKIVGLATAGTGVALLATGLYFGLQASSASDDLTELNDTEGMWTPAHRELYNRGKRDELISALCYASGGAAIVGGGVLYYLGWRQDRAARVDVAIVPTRGGVAVGASWSF